MNRVPEVATLVASAPGSIDFWLEGLGGRLISSLIHAANFLSHNTVTHGMPGDISDKVRARDI